MWASERRTHCMTGHICRCSMVSTVQAFGSNVHKTATILTKENRNGHTMELNGTMLSNIYALIGY